MGKTLLKTFINHPLLYGKVGILRYLINRKVTFFPAVHVNLMFFFSNSMKNKINYVTKFHTDSKPNNGKFITHKIAIVFKFYLTMRPQGKWHKEM